MVDNFGNLATIARNMQEESVKVKLDTLMAKHLIADSELARAAGVSEKTIKSLRHGSRQSRMQTKRTILDGLNSILKKRDSVQVGAEIFD